MLIKQVYQKCVIDLKYAKYAKQNDVHSCFQNNQKNNMQFHRNPPPTYSMFKKLQVQMFLMSTQIVDTCAICALTHKDHLYIYYLPAFAECMKFSSTSLELLSIKRLDLYTVYQIKFCNFSYFITKLTILRVSRGIEVFDFLRHQITIQSKPFSSRTQNEKLALLPKEIASKKHFSRSSHKNKSNLISSDVVVVVVVGASK